MARLQLPMPRRRLERPGPAQERLRLHLRALRYQPKRGARVLLQQYWRLRESQRQAPTLVSLVLPSARSGATRWRALQLCPTARRRGRRAVAAMKGPIKAEFALLKLRFVRMQALPAAQPLRHSSTIPRPPGIG